MHDSTPAPAATPQVGDLLYDAASRRVGVLMDTLGGRLMLRPPRGGIEWEAEPGDVRPPSASEALTERVREANRRSAEGRH